MSVTIAWDMRVGCLNESVGLYHSCIFLSPNWHVLGRSSHLSPDVALWEVAVNCFPLFFPQGQLSAFLLGLPVSPKPNCFRFKESNAHVKRNKCWLEILGKSKKFTISLNLGGAAVKASVGTSKHKALENEELARSRRSWAEAGRRLLYSYWAKHKRDSSLGS